ncbi:MAG: hypothetical protein ACTSP4_01910 [Candidatus Hodarchaeales archaeon]
MAKFRKQPDGEFPGFPTLELDDIDHETFREGHYICLSLVNNRRGRVVLHFPVDEYKMLIEAVKNKKGSYSEENLTEACKEAVMSWARS